MKKIFTEKWKSPIGELVLGECDGKLCICTWENETESTRRWVAQRLTADVNEKSTENTREAIRQLEEYFAGERRTFSLPLLLTGTTFQKKAWQAMLSVAYGTTITYAEEARMTGHPKAFRAVGNANGSNPMAIIVPCHRIVAAGGGIGGYSAGIEKKAFLLKLEQENSR